MVEMILFTTFLLIVLLVIWVSEEMWGEGQPKRRERAGRDTPPPVKFGDMLILMGSEGENLPRLDIRREVAEQLGCEDDTNKGDSN
jgi:hypothetical protein